MATAKYWAWTWPARTSLSKSQVSEMAGHLDAQVTAFRERPASPDLLRSMVKTFAEAMMSVSNRRGGAGTRWRVGAGRAKCRPAMSSAGAPGAVSWRCRLARVGCGRAVSQQVQPAENGPAVSLTVGGTPSPKPLDPRVAAGATYSSSASSAAHAAWHGQCWPQELHSVPTHWWLTSTCTAVCR